MLFCPLEFWNLGHYSAVPFHALTVRGYKGVALFVKSAA
jgi:hypothetical protein